jgi:hypothetical protein
MSRSRELCSNSRRLVIVSAQVRVRSERSRLDAAAARAYRTSVEGSGREVEDFQVTGLVESVPAMACG